MAVPTSITYGSVSPGAPKLVSQPPSLRTLNWSSGVSRTFIATCLLPSSVMYIGPSAFQLLPVLAMEPIMPQVLTWVNSFQGLPCGTGMVTTKPRTWIRPSEST